MLTKGVSLRNRYRIEDSLGQGGMGAVYRAWDIHLGMWTAVKENFDTSPAAYQQFQREASMLARLSHPSLPRVTDHFFLPEHGQYLVMDFVEGPDLEAILHQHQVLSEAQLLPWILQVCDALAYLHRQSPPIIHRDIKPANIKIRPEGQAVLVDFGIAKFYNPHLSTTMGAKAVTPGYSPPEQYGDGRTDGRSDIYALGATLYHLLTGQKPPESVQRMVADVAVSPPRQLNPRISPVTEQVIVKSIALTASQRYQKIDRLRAALRQRPAADRRPPTIDRQPARQVRQGQPEKPLTVSPPNVAQAKSDAGLIIGVAAVIALLLGVIAFFALLGGGLSGSKAPAAIAETNAVAPAASAPTATAPDITLDDPAGEATATPNAQLTLAGPENDYNFLPGEAVVLRWAWPLAEGQQFRLIAQGPAGRVVDERLTAAEFSLEAGQLSPGAYTWLVLVEENGGERARSAPRQFSVQAPATATTTATALAQPASPAGTPSPAQTTPGSVPPPAGAKLPAPVLMGPEDEGSFVGIEPDFEFRWKEAPRPLAKDEYYVLVIEHSIGKDFNWLKETVYTLKDKKWMSDQSLEWRVVIARAQTADPNEVQENPSGGEVSDTSETRTFHWKVGTDDGGDGGGDSGGTPAPAPP